jgi:hypothetical protein
LCQGVYKGVCKGVYKGECKGVSGKRVAIPIQRPPNWNMSLLRCGCRNRVQQMRTHMRWQCM